MQKRDLHTRFDQENPETTLKHRIEKDRFQVTFCWMLFIEFLVGVGFPIADLFSARSRSRSADLVSLIRPSLVYSLLGSLVIGSVIAALAFQRLRAIQSGTKTLGKGLSLFGISITGVLITALGILCIIVFI